LAAECGATPDVISARAWSLVEQSHRDLGVRLRLPFVDSVGEQFHPQLLEDRLNDWAAACLPSGDTSYARLDCRAYPCVYAFEADTTESCLDSLGATRLLQVQPIRTVDGVRNNLPLLYEAVFRDPSDIQTFGDLVDTQEAASRIGAASAYQPRTAAPGARVGFTVKVVRVLADDTHE
jgi:hypothetical protein